MAIIFDPAKRLLTLDQRGLDFADAGKVFDGTHLTIEDDRLDYGETRYFTVGFLDAARRRSAHHQHEEGQ